jgi:hypothetical protein
MSRLCCAVVVLCTLLIFPSLVPARTPFTSPSKSDPGVRSIMVLDGSPVHDTGELRLHMSNWGMFGSWPGSPYPFASAPSGEWPAGSGTEHVFTGGMWVGALKEGVPAVSTAAYQWEFRPSQDVRDVVFESAEGAVGGVRRGFPGADDDNDGATDEDWLNGYDDDLDGQVDEDYAAISDQMLSRQYTDNQPSAIQAYPEHNPLNIHVRETSYQWEHDEYDDFVGTDYEITNVGADVWENVYVGIFLDGDVGDRDTPNYYNNDVAAWRRFTSCTEVGAVKIDYGYIADELIGSGLGVLLLDHPVDPNGEWAPATVKWSTFAVFSGTQSYEDGGDPTNDFERYQLMSQRAIERDGTTPRDYRIMLSAGPFSSVAPGASIKFSVALVAFSLEDQSNVVRAAVAYRGRWLNADDDPNTGVEGRETHVIGPAEVIIDPCRPGYDQPIAIARGDDEWINWDCEQEESYQTLCGYDDPEQYATGVNGKEYHAHWMLPGDDIPTPVAIQRFDARLEGTTVRLEWDVWTDEGITGYDVLRATGSGPLVAIANSLPGGVRDYRDTHVQPGTRYEYQLVARGGADGFAMSQRIGITMPALALALEPGSPNPFNGSTRIRFTVPERARVTVAIFDAAGRRVSSLSSSDRQAGAHELTWDGTDTGGAVVSAGVYFVRMEAGKQRRTQKLLLVR